MKFKRLLLTLALTVTLSMGCAMAISRDGLFVSAGDAISASGDTTTEGGELSESFANLISSLAKLIPFAQPSAPDVTVAVVIPQEDN